MGRRGRGKASRGLKSRRKEQRGRSLKVLDAAVGLHGGVNGQREEKGGQEGDRKKKTKNRENKMKQSWNSKCRGCVCGKDKKVSENDAGMGSDRWECLLIGSQAGLRERHRGQTRRRWRILCDSKTRR